MTSPRLLCASVLLVASGWAVAEDSWQFQLTPYIWFSGAKGDVATLPGLPEASFELTPSEAISDNEAAYMLVFDMRKGRHGFLLDAQYTDTRSDFELVPALGLEVENISKNTIISAAYEYTLIGDESVLVDAFGGVRYWDVESILTFSGGPGPLGGTRLDNTEDWFDPFIGIKGRSSLGSSDFFARGWLAVGGFGAGSDLFYDTLLNVGYQWNRAIDTSIGYRIIDVDYEDGDYVYDVKLSGWLVGLGWRF